jgi:hypothetical protein
MAVKIPVEAFWVVTLCSVVAGYQRFEGPCCLHLQVVTRCNDVVGYQRFEGPCCVQLQIMTSSGDIVGYQGFGGLRCVLLQGKVLRQQSPPKRWYRTVTPIS